MRQRSVPQPVGSIMTSRVVTVRPDVPVTEAIAAFERFRFRHLLVVDDAGRLVGVLSDRDTLRCVARGWDPAEALVSSIMNTKPAAVRADASVKEAIDLMSFHRVHCLPVLDGSGALRGIVTTSDVLGMLYDLLDHLEPPEPLPAA